MQLELGLDIIRSYKRLAYTPWHALAELVDNSTQAYFNNKEEMDAAFERASDVLRVSIVYDPTAGMIRVADNSIGMSADDLSHALHVGARPVNTTGRSKFGMGLKTAACWLGNNWTVRTKRLGETVEHQVEVDVEAVADGSSELPYRELSGRDSDDHYTIVEIRDLNRRFQGRTLGKIRDFLSSMYRQDLRRGILVLEWQGTAVTWNDDDGQFLRAQDGSYYRKDFDFDVGGKRVHGWVAILNKGSRARAGFSILHADRVVKGWPESWRPESIFGQIGGSNDLVNQRLVGELNLDEFEVSHTKDDILWLGSEEDDVQRELQNICSDYIAVARARRKNGDDERGPTDLEIQTAVEELQQELSSAEIVDLLSIESIPPPEVIALGVKPLIGIVSGRDPAFQANLGGFSVSGFLVGETSPNDPYVVVDATSSSRVTVIVNLQHPHIEQLVGSEGFLNYLRHCTYDAIAEWQARHKAANIDPDTIKALKDRLLRIPMEMEMHAPAVVGDS